MASTMTTADSILKEDYLPVVREQLNDKAQFLMQIEQNSSDIEGRRAVLSLHVSRNSGIGSRADDGTLPTAGNQGSAEERIPVYHHYGRMQITGPVMRASKSDKGSFTRALRYEQSNLVDDLKRDLNRQAFGDGTGAIAETTVSTTGQTTVLLATTTTAVQMRQLEVGMLVDIGTLAELNAGSGGPTYGNAIVSISVSGKSFVVTSNLGTATAAGDFVARAGNGGALGGSTQREITGLQAIVDSTGTLFNVNPSTNPVWSSVEDTTGGTPTENLFAKVIHSIDINGGGNVDLIVTSDGVHRAFANNLTSLKRFPTTIDLKGGYKELDVAAGGGSVPLVWDRDAPGSQAFFLDKKHLTLFSQCDWEWMDDDGAVLSRVLNKDAYEAVLYRDLELATDKRNAHGKATGLTEA